MIFMTTFLKGPHKQTNDHSLKDSLSPTTLICSPFLSPTESWGEISTSHEEMVTPGTLESQSITQAPPSYFYLFFFKTEATPPAASPELTDADVLQFFYWLTSCPAFFLIGRPP